MPGYIKPTEIDTLQLPSDAAFEIHMKRTATHGDLTAARSAMLKVENTAAGVITHGEWGAYIHTLVRRLIVNWNLTDESGQPLPITEANLENLKADDGDFLATEAQKRAPAQRTANA
jgi:hypothetical protein